MKSHSIFLEKLTEVTSISHCGNLFHGCQVALNEFLFVVLHLLKSCCQWALIVIKHHIICFPQTALAHLLSKALEVVVIQGNTKGLGVVPNTLLKATALLDLKEEGGFIQPRPAVETGHLWLR